jgi:hypothetical protein
MKSRRVRSLLLAALFSLAAVVSARPSDALPKVGEPRPSARAVDADDRTIDIGTIAGKPILVVYEDKESATLNTALKADLSRLAKGDRYRNAVALVPVANLAGYDYWPVRGFVKDAIRDESKKLGTTIYSDWNGSFRQSLGIAGNTSTVFLVGRNGRVLWAWQGLVPKEERERLIELLRAEIER